MIILESSLNFHFPEVSNLSVHTFKNYHPLSNTWYSNYCWYNCNSYKLQLKSMYYIFLCCSLNVIIEFSISSIISLSFSTNSGDGFTSCKSLWNLFTFALIFPNCCFSLLSVNLKKWKHSGKVQRQWYQ